MVNKKRNLFLIIAFLVLLSVAICYFLINNKVKNENFYPSLKYSPVEIQGVLPNTLINHHLRVSGIIESSWMFEGVFTVKVLDSKRNVIFQTQGRETTPGSWTSPGIVEFNVNIDIEPTTKSGFIVVESANPSGLPENQKIHEIPVKFK